MMLTNEVNVELYLDANSVAFTVCYCSHSNIITVVDISDSDNAVTYYISNKKSLLYF